MDHIETGNPSVMPRVNKPRHPLIAAVLTLVLLGLGHLYAGNPIRGLILCAADLILLFSLGLALLYFIMNLTYICIAVAVYIAFIIFCVVDAFLIAEKKKDYYEPAKYNRWFVYLGCYIALTLLISLAAPNGLTTYFVKTYKIASGSMAPTLLPGDYFLVNKYIYRSAEPGRGDIIAYQSPEEPAREYVKRVVAVGGDTVQMIERKLYVNGEYVTEPYVQFSDKSEKAGKINPRDNFGPFHVPPQKLFVLGDNRDNSVDSRTQGYIDISAVIGKAMTIYFSWDRANHVVRRDRMGEVVK
jgi:signal peptidase I